MPCDSRVSEPGGGDLWGLLSERLECARNRPLSFVTLRYSLTGKYGQKRTVATACTFPGPLRLGLVRDIEWLSFCTNDLLVYVLAELLIELMTSDTPHLPNPRVSEQIAELSFPTCP